MDKKSKVIKKKKRKSLDKQKSLDTGENDSSKSNRTLKKSKSLDIASTTNREASSSPTTSSSNIVDSNRVASDISNNSNNQFSIKQNNYVNTRSRDDSTNKKKIQELNRSKSKDDIDVKKKESQSGQSNEVINTKMEMDLGESSIGRNSKNDTESLLEGFESVNGSDDNFLTLDSESDLSESDQSSDNNEDELNTKKRDGNIDDSLTVNSDNSAKNNDDLKSDSKDSVNGDEYDEASLDKRKHKKDLGEDVTERSEKETEDNERAEQKAARVDLWKTIKGNTTVNIIPKKMNKLVKDLNIELDKDLSARIAKGDTEVFVEEMSNILDKIREKNPALADKLTKGLVKGLTKGSRIHLGGVNINFLIDEEVDQLKIEAKDVTEEDLKKRRKRIEDIGISASDAIRMLTKTTFKNNQLDKSLKEKSSKENDSEREN